MNQEREEQQVGQDQRDLANASENERNADNAAPVREAKEEQSQDEANR